MCVTDSQLLDACEQSRKHRLDLSGGTRAHHRVSLSLELLGDVLQHTNTSDLELEK